VSGESLSGNSLGSAVLSADPQGAPLGTTGAQVDSAIALDADWFWVAGDIVGDVLAADIYDGIDSVYSQLPDTALVIASGNHDYGYPSFSPLADTLGSRDTFFTPFPQPPAHAPGDSNAWSKPLVWPHAIIIANSRYNQGTSPVIDNNYLSLGAIGREYRRQVDAGYEIIHLLTHYGLYIGQCQQSTDVVKNVSAFEDSVSMNWPLLFYTWTGHRHQSNCVRAYDPGGGNVFYMVHPRSANHAYRDATYIEFFLNGIQIRNINTGL
jgi:hypothetical protein